ncbi:hypothetical protein KSC_024050 [Ktedonobacter sp. SOSP1-52]|nr:hypothetical protein KSC_024050 [Ktedonobacter sp. SOSP1-52]
MEATLKLFYEPVFRPPYNRFEERVDMMDMNALNKNSLQSREDVQTPMQVQIAHEQS